MFKNKEVVDKLLTPDGGKFLQGKINKQAAKAIKFVENPFLSKAMVDHINDSEDEITPEE